MMQYTIVKYYAFLPSLVKVIVMMVMMLEVIMVPPLM